MKSPACPHTPLQATREDYDALSFIPDHTMRVYAAMIRSLDRNIGRVLQSLKDQQAKLRRLRQARLDDDEPQGESEVVAPSLHGPLHQKFLKCQLLLCVFSLTQNHHQC